MTNLEQICGRLWGVDSVTNTICECSRLLCSHCLLNTDNGHPCDVNRKTWLMSEAEKYQIPEDTEVDTKCIVSNDGGVHRYHRFFSGKFNSHGMAIFFNDGKSSWSYSDDESSDVTRDGEIWYNVEIAE